MRCLNFNHGAFLNYAFLIGMYNEDMDMISSHLEGLVSYYQVELAACRGVIQQIASCKTIEEVRGVLSVYEQMLRGSLGIDVSQQRTGVQDER